MKYGETMEKIRDSILNIPIDDYKNYIFKRFKKLCGFSECGEIDRDRADEAVLCFWENLSVLKLKAVYSVFSEILKSKVSEFIFFAVSADIGDYYVKKSLAGGNILKEFYFDLTGTAVIDVSRHILKSYFENSDYIKKTGLCVSNAFGPGFFGIEHKEVFRFFKLLDCNKIGLYVNESGVIYPEKSFVGFFVISKNEIFIENDCEHCVGNKNGCFFCEKKYNFQKKIFEN